MVWMHLWSKFDEKLFVVCKTHKRKPHFHAWHCVAFGFTVRFISLWHFSHAVSLYLPHHNGEIHDKCTQCVTLCYYTKKKMPNFFYIQPNLVFIRVLLLFLLFMRMYSIFCCCYSVWVNRCKCVCVCVTIQNKTRAKHFSFWVCRSGKKRATAHAEFNQISLEKLNFHHIEFIGLMQICDTNNLENVHQLRGKVKSNEKFAKNHTECLPINNNVLNVLEHFSCTTQNTIPNNFNGSSV